MNPRWHDLQRVSLLWTARGLETEKRKNRMKSWKLFMHSQKPREKPGRPLAPLKPAPSWGSTAPETAAQAGLSLPRPHCRAQGEVGWWPMKHVCCPGVRSRRHPGTKGVQGWAPTQWAGLPKMWRPRRQVPSFNISSPPSAWRVLGLAAPAAAWSITVGCPQMTTPSKGHPGLVRPLLSDPPRPRDALPGLLLALADIRHNAAFEGTMSNRGSS